MGLLDAPAVVAYPPDGGTRLLFLEAPEGKTAKNRGQQSP